MNHNLHFVHVILLIRVERYQVIRPQDTVRVEWFLARFFPEKQHFIHHSTLRNVMLWKKAWRKRAFGKKKTDFRVSRFAISLKKKQQQQQERQQQNENKETERTEEEQKKQPWRNCASHELPNREEISLALYKCATRILFLNKWKPETSILSGQDKHWTLCYLLMTGFFLNRVLFFLLSIFVSFWHFLTWPRPCIG